MPTPRLGAPEWAIAQALPETTGNEIVRNLEQGAGARSWKSRTTLGPPASPSEADEYLIPAGATGVWATHVGEIAFVLNGAWQYVTPYPGMVAFILDEGGFVGTTDGTTTWLGLGLTVDDDTTLASDSHSTPPTVHAVKAFVAAAVTGILDFKGSLDCSANPNYPAASKGDSYVVSVAGKIGGASGTSVSVGDVIFATADNAGGDQATVGASWDTIVHSAQVLAPNVQAVTSAATVTPTFSNDLVKITAQAAGLTLANWTGTAVAGWGMAIRIKDNGTARSIAYGTKYRGIGVTLPTTTVLGKTLYLGIIYNSDDDKFDVVAVAQEA